MAHDVFISYSSKDKPTAVAIRRRLRDHGFTSWMAPDDVPKGGEYAEVIVDAISESRVMVLVLSSHTSDSLHVRKELDLASGHGVTILPFRIEDVQPGKSIIYFLSLVQWLDALTEPLEPHIDQLADAIRERLAAKPKQLSSWRVQPAVSKPVPPESLPPVQTHHAPPSVPSVPTVPPQPPVTPDQRRTRTLVMVSLMLLGSAFLGWLILEPGNDEGFRDIPIAVEKPPDTPRDQPADTVSNARAAASGSRLVGCWRWPNNVAVVFGADGSVAAGPISARWRHVAGNRYALTWPEPVDTLTMSADGRRLSGGNQFGIPIAASRNAGGPSLEGVWNWPGGAMAIVGGNGTVQIGAFTGRWRVADRAQRVYQITWPKAVDEITIADDGTRLEGRNQYGFVLSAARLAQCG